MKTKKKEQIRPRGTINVSAEMFDALQALQEHIRVQEGLLSRPTYTDLVYRMWEAYQEKNSSSDATLTS